MRIGIDASPLQSGSRMRGIGYSLINVLNNLTPEQKAEHSFVFYMAHTGQYDPLELINTDGMEYTTAYLEPFHPWKNLPGQLRIFTKLINKFRLAGHQWVGGAHFKHVQDIDIFFQIDQAAGLPPKRRVRSALFLHDIIPYVMEAEYLWSYRTARQRGLRRKRALGCFVARVSYVIKVRLVLRRASILLANSEWTKHDYIKFFGVSPKKITVTPLGVNGADTPVPAKAAFTEARPSSWGYLPEPVDLTEKPFLLFVGGADPRRRLVDLVAAYNTLRAQGTDLRLVFAGDSMQSPDTVGNPLLQSYLRKHSAYSEDISFLGFVTDDQREWLYAHALAFVFPSVYEGFGLPILEAMERDCPVITYMNTSITEVAGDAVMIAHDFDDIATHVKTLMADKKVRSSLIAKGHKQAAQFAWKKNAKNIMAVITSH